MTLPNPVRWSRYFSIRLLKNAIGTPMDADKTNAKSLFSIGVDLYSSAASYVFDFFQQTATYTIFRKNAGLGKLS